jgi:hypothetical protein
MTIRFPLRLVRKGPGYYLIDASERTVAAMNADKQDAEFILRASNAHDELLAACKSLLESADEEHAAGFAIQRCADHPQITAIRAAIATAQGDKPCT